ncbi:MAG: protein BatD [Hahellaceae bacterium]|nr:protein BatD [Hahellaceae bacterium]MCP5211986.1 protein BatD [Hahellaceae bacterium]
MMRLHCVNVLMRPIVTSPASWIKRRVLTQLRTLCWLLLLSLPFQPVNAQDKLDVSVDKTQLYETETIELRVVGNIKFEFNFGSLLSLNNLNLPEPEINGLEKDFDVLDRKQQYNVQSVNGDNRAEITWLYTLAPKSAGNLAIPAIKFKDAESAPIDITVLAGKPKILSTEAPPIFLEVSVDKTAAYVQEQIIVTMRLYHQGNLASGELTKPEPENAIIEQLGEQTKYSRMHNNRRYEVIERNYLVFPQKSGTLTIFPQTFTGTLIDPRSRQRKYAREFSDAKTIDVKSPPTSFTGQQWLPAMSIYLTESWSKPVDTIQVGDSVTRTLNLQALGMLGSALPPFEVSEPRGLKLYPDQEKRSSEPHKAGANSQLSQSFAMVAIAPGKVTLPEIRIPWWDTVNNVERVAVLPTKEITVIAATNQSVSANNQLDQKSIANSLPADSDSSTTNTSLSDGHSGVAQTWQWLFWLTLTGWLITVVYCFTKISRLKSALTGVSLSSTLHQKNNERLKRITIADIVTAIKNKRPDTLGLISHWAAQLQSQHDPDGKQISNYQDTKNFFADNGKMLAALRDIEASLYAKDRISLDDSTLNSLEICFREAADSVAKSIHTSSEAEVIPSFYPKK